MCGRFVAASDPDGLTRFFVVDERKDADTPPSYNVAPTDPVRAVVEHAQRRYLVTLRWGLVPHWAEDPKVGARMINARSETAADKPAYRDAFTRRRCIIPADGFYEWETSPDGAKVPHYVRPAEQPVFAFAGLWEVWRDRTASDAEPLRTCTILTMEAAPDLADLHPRMPVVLPEATWEAWLDRDLADVEAVRGLLGAASPGVVERHRVSTAVNSVRNNAPGLIVPA